MKICIIGLDNATPEVIFQDERLTNLRRLMDVGLYGMVPSIRSATGGSAWQCMLASQNAISADSQSLWQVLTGQGKNSLLAEFPASSMHMHADHEGPLSDQNLHLSREQWQEVNRRLTLQDWEGFQFIDFGLTRLVEHATQPGLAADEARRSPNITLGSTSRSAC